MMFILGALCVPMDIIMPFSSASIRLVYMLKFKISMESTYQLLFNLILQVLNLITEKVTYLIPDLTEIFEYLLFIRVVDAH